MPLDYVLNGRAHGEVGAVLMEHDFNPGALRPFVGADGRSYITVNQKDRNGNFVINQETGKPLMVAVPVQNSPYSLRVDEWKHIDRQVRKAAQQRLKLVADLRASNLVYTMPNGMGHSVLQTQNQSDVGDADVSMDARRRGNADRPLYDLTSLPLPIIHKDFEFGARELAVSRNLGQPLDVSTGELAARKVAETAEKLAIGTYGTYAFGGGTVYGLINYTNRLTKVITNPTAGGWVPTTTLDEVLAMKQQSMDAYHYGPWKLYASATWDQYLDNDFSAAKGDLTLRERLMKIDGINEVKTLDFLTGTQLVLVSQTTDVIRLVIGMDVVTVRWESMGGMQVNFKVMAILVPQIRCDYNSRTGIVHGNVA